MRNGTKLGWGLTVAGLVTGLYGAAGAAGAAPPAAAAEHLRQADQFLVRIEVAATGARRQLETARGARDVVKTLCLNDKLTQIDVALRSARDRRTSLEQATARKDTELANHEFTILTVLRQRAEQLDAEADQCIGAEGTYLGDSRVTTQIDPNLPQTDPSSYPELPVVTAVPPCASCTK